MLCARPSSAPRLRSWALASLTERRRARSCPSKGVELAASHAGMCPFRPSFLVGATLPSLRGGVLAGPQEGLHAVAFPCRVFDAEIPSSFALVIGTWISLCRCRRRRRQSSCFLRTLVGPSSLCFRASMLVPTPPWQASTWRSPHPAFCQLHLRLDVVPLLSYRPVCRPVRLEHIPDLLFHVEKEIEVPMEHLPCAPHRLHRFHVLPDVALPRARLLSIAYISEIFGHPQHCRLPH
jgi:hypothetical protein